MEYECPVPNLECNGKLIQVEPRNRSMKIHQSIDELRSCIRKYLTEQGYKSKSNREFHKSGEPVLVVSKHPGMKLRKGKEGTRSMAKRLNSPIKVL